MAAEQTLRAYRIGEGGPLRRIEIAAHLTSLPLQIATAVAGTWLPVMVIGLLEWRFTGQREPLLRDPSMHVRLLVAAPLLLALDHIFPRVCRTMLEQLQWKSFVPAADQPRFDRVLNSATRLADAALPEILLALLGLGLGVGALFGLLGTDGLSRHATFTAAQLWYTLTDWPFFQFLLWRSLWRWAIWVRILVGVSRIELDLVPAHPDRCGGIQFLRLPSVGYCAALLFAISSVLCAAWRAKFSTGATLSSFAPLLLIFATVGALVALGPLLLFAPRLSRARRDGLAEYGGLAVDVGRHLRRQRDLAHDPQRPLDDSDIAPMANLVEVYREAIDRLGLLLFDTRDLIVLLAATVAPLVPLMLFRVPGEDWRALLSAISGGLL